MSRVGTLFGYGFRVFFLSCAACAAAVMTAWVGVFTFGWSVAGSRPMAWHAHEMLFGVGSAAIAGFLLTAVPNWTGTERLHGRALAALWLLWLAGRMAFWVSYPLTTGAAALAARAIDLAFLPLLAVIVARPIIATGNRRNLIVIAVLAGLFVANLALTLMPARGPVLALDLVTLLMILIGGRIAPLFTRNWLVRKGLDGDVVQSHSWLDIASLVTMLLVLITDLAGLSPGIVGPCAILAALASLGRLIEWQGWRAWSDPLVWVLHLGYLWIVMALMIRGFGHLTELVSPRAWIHALGIGAMGTLIIGIMPRVSLGHTGRTLTLPRGGSIMLWLMTVAAVTRTGNALGWFDHAWALTTAGLAWIIAFLLFIGHFLPVLSAPRPDGRPG